MPARCPKCQLANEYEAPVCHYCGEPLQARCSRCGATVAPGARLCAACQRRPKGEPANPSGTPLVVAGRYRVLRKVVQRRTSTVYRARDEQTGATVALKRLDTVGLVTAADRRQAIAEFQREAKRLAALRHPNLATVLDHFCERETCWLVTAWAEGFLLREVHDQGPQPESRVRLVGAQIADALAYLHAQKPPVVFRDLKMSHVVIDAQDQVTLLDLGLSRFFKSGQGRGAAERGTPPYEAPEQADSGFASPQSDIYALGTLLLALLWGPATSRDKGAVSPAMQEVLARARRRNPAERYPDAASFRDALQPGLPLPRPEPAAATAGAPALTLITQKLRVLRRPDRDTVRYRIRLLNESAETVRAVVKSTQPWLTLEEPEVELAPGEGQAIVVVHMQSLPRQDVEVPRAIVIEAGRRLQVAVELVDQEPQPELAPESLDFGEVDLEPVTRSLTVRNAGGGRLLARLSASQPWLHLAQTELALTGGQTADVAVTLDAEHAPAGGDYQRALKLDSDHGQAWAAVSFSRGRAEMVVETERLDFGTITSAEPVEMRLPVGNRGTAALTLKAESGHEAVRVSPERVAIPPQHRGILRVRLEPAALPPGRLVHERAIRLSSNAGSVAVPVQALVQRAQLAVSERLLDFGTLDADEAAGRELPLVVSNRGNVPLTFTIETAVPWLSVWPAEGRLEGGGSTIVSLRLTAAAAAAPGPQVAEPALVIHSDPGPLPVTVRFILVKPMVAVEPLSLDFGMISAGGVSERTVEVSNEGSGVLQWQAETDSTWIELSPDGGECAAGHSQTVAVRAYALGLPAEARQGRGAIRFIGPHNDVTIPATVAVSRPQLVVEPVLELGRSIDYGPVSARLILFNRGVGELSGEVSASLPWLSVSPARFEIASGGSAALTVTATPPEDAHTAEIEAPGAIAVVSNGGAAGIDVRLELVTRPRIEVTPDRLVLKAGAEGTIMVRNAGLGTYNGEVAATAPWLKVRPNQLTIRQGQRARVSVTADPGDHDEPLSADVVVGKGAERSQVEVTVT